MSLSYSPSAMPSMVEREQALVLFLSEFRFPFRLFKRNSSQDVKKFCVFHRCESRSSSLKSLLGRRLNRTSRLKYSRHAFGVLLTRSSFPDFFFGEPHLLQLELNNSLMFPTSNIYKHIRRCPESERESERERELAVGSQSGGPVYIHSVHDMYK